MTYTSYKEHCDLYTIILGSIAVNSFQFELPQKDIILLLKGSLIVCKAGKRTGVKCTEFIALPSQRELIQLMILMRKSE